MRLSPIDSQAILSEAALGFFLVGAKITHTDYDTIIVPVIFDFFRVLQPAPRVSSANYDSDDFSMQQVLPDIGTDAPPGYNRSLRTRYTSFTDILINPVPAPVIEPIPFLAYSHDYQPGSSGSVRLPVPHASEGVSSVLCYSAPNADSSE